MADFVSSMKSGLLSEPTSEERRNAVNARRNFLARLNRLGFSASNRFLLCEDLYMKAIAEPTDRLLRLYCMIACDSGFLLDLDRTGHNPRTDAMHWQRQKQDSDRLYTEMLRRKRMSERFQQAIKLATRYVRKRLHPELLSAPTDMDLARQVLDEYIEITRPTGDTGQLHDNILTLLCRAGSCAVLTQLKPLFLFQALTLYADRLITEDVRLLDLTALWRHQSYRRGEGSDWDKTRCDCLNRLYEVLYTICRSQPDVDAELCLYGYDHLSDLGQFYREHHSDSPVMSFEPLTEVILAPCRYTCFEHGDGDNVMLASSGMNIESMTNYIASAEQGDAAWVNHVFAYVRTNIASLTARFLELDSEHPDSVQALCEEILQDACCGPVQQPRGDEERAFLLAAINKALMQSVDGWANDYLIRTGKILVGDDPLQLGGGE